MKKILVTDSLFISEEHMKQLQEAGYEVQRLDKPVPTEEELIKNIGDKSGYIIGGLEKVTEKVVTAGKQLEAIVYTGTAWDVAITGKAKAKERNIKISNAPHLNANSVAEWVLSSTLAMNRNLFALGRTDTKTFQTTNELESLTVGIVGLGHIGRRLAELFSSIGVEVVYWNRTDKNAPGCSRQELDKVLAISDVVLVCLSASAGEGWLDKDKLARLKSGAIINCLTEPVLNEEDLLRELSDGRIRAFLDWTPKAKGYSSLSNESFYCSNESTAYNTKEANSRISDSSVQSMINLLEKGEDKNRVL